MKLAYSYIYKHSQFQCKISPNNHYVANAVDNRLVIRRQDQEMSVLYVYDSKRPIDYIQWSPNSEYIFSINYEQSRVNVRSTGDPKWHGSITDEGFPIVRVKWSFDSKNILCISELKLRLAIWNLSTQQMKYVNHIKYSEKGIETSPNGQYVAIIEKKGGKDYIGIYHGNSFILLRSFEVDTVDLENIKWSPDSTLIAVWDNCLYHKLLVYRVDGHLCTAYSGYEYGLGVKSVNWSPRGDILALGNFDQTIHLLSTLAWQLIGILDHPTKLNTTTDMNVLEEADIATDQTIHYRHVLKRPLNIPMKRPDHNEANPKMGIGFFQFSPDGLYIYSKCDNMPTVLWIWKVKTLSCLHILQFKNQIKQLLCNPRHDRLLLVSCGDTRLHFIEPTVENDGINLDPVVIPTSDFTIRKLQWSSNGNALLLMDTSLFCLSVS